MIIYISGRGACGPRRSLAWYLANFPASAEAL